MTETDDKDAQTTTGAVKWFDPAKGFGFVIADSGGPDILLHANVLRNFGQSSVADGSRIRLSVMATERGQQAVEVFEITPPDTGTRIDFILADPTLARAAQDAQVVRTGIVNRTSDHYPVLVDFARDGRR